MSMQIKTYLKYIFYSIALIIPLATIQFLYVYKVSFSDPSTFKLYMIPFTVSVIFGSFIAHTVLLRFQLKQTQKSLIQEAKMASLGHLVKSVAHEINTPAGNTVTLISVIQGHQKDLKNELQKERPRRDIIKENIQAIDKSLSIMSDSMQEISSLVNSFKTISADTSDDYKEINLNTYLNSLLNTFSAEFNLHHIELSLDNSRSVHIETYPSLLIQVLSQCINNAMHHAFDNSEAAVIDVTVEKDENHAIIKIGDNGKGIDPKHLPKVFDPFTMEKRKKNHVGLGLSMVYNIVTENLKGTIEAYNKKEQGALFVIKIPFSLKV